MPARLNPVMGSVNGYGSVAKNAINDTLYRQTVRPMGGVRNGYQGAASRAVRTSPLANEVRAANRGRRMAGINAAKKKLGPMHGPIHPGGVDTGMFHGPLRLGGVDTGMMHGPKVPKGMKMSRKSMMGIGLGLGVAAAVAMNRRGEGASSGRQSAYRY